MSDQYAKSSRRQRVYKRKFDHDEARRRYHAGESTTQLGQEFGVSAGAIWNVVHRPAENMKPSTHAEQRALLGKWRYSRSHDNCPGCQGPKARTAKLCRTCHYDGRIGVMKLKRVPGQRRAILAGVPNGRIVSYEGSDAVVESYSPDPRYRVLHFWDRPAEVVDSNITVQVRPSWRVEVEEAA